MKQSRFKGRWEIYELSEFDTDYLNEVEPAYIEFDDGSGEFHFGVIYAWFHYLEGADEIHFTYEGDDEFDPIFGSGYAELVKAELHGCIEFDNGDGTEFKARRIRKKAKKSK